MDAEALSLDGSEASGARAVVESQLPAGPVAEAGAEPLAPASPASAASVVRVELTLCEAGTGAPVVGARILVKSSREDWGEERGLETDELGRCSFAAAEGQLTWRLEPKPGGEQLALAPHALTIGGEPEPEPGLRRVQVKLYRPPAVLDVLVLHADGRPATNALVELSHYGSRRTAPQATTDELGRVRLSIWDPARLWHALLKARTPEGEVSDLLSIETPFVPGERRLVLRPGASLLVEVLEHDGRRGVGRSVSFEDHASRTFESAGADESGHVRFTGCFAGSAYVSLELPGYTESVGEAVDLLPPREGRVRLRVPELGGELLLSGIVVDEEDRPLPGVDLLVSDGGEDEHWLSSDEQGRFSLSGPRPGPLQVRTGLDVGNDRFEPDPLVVPRGTQGIVLRRVEAALSREFELTVVDGETGAELSRYAAGVTRPRIEWSGWWSDDSPKELDCRVTREDLLFVRAPGYALRTVPLLAALERSAAPGTLTIALQRGLAERTRFYDCDEGARLPGLRLIHPGGAVVITDAKGEASLEAPDWSPWTVEREGHEPETWDPSEGWEWDALLREPWIGCDGE